MQKRITFSFLLIMQLAYSGLFAQNSNLDKSKFSNQILTLIESKLIKEYEEIIEQANKEFTKDVDKRINKIESELLKISNFNYLLYEFEDLGISTDNPNISKGLRNISNDITKFLKTKGPITSKEIKGYIKNWWEPSVTIILDKESVEIVGELYQLVSSGNERLQKLRNIQQTSPDLSESDLKKAFKSAGLPENFLKKIAPLQKIIEFGIDNYTEAAENSKAFYNAFTSDNPTDRISLLFELGSKYGGKIPITGQFIELLFKVAKEILKSAKSLGAALNKNFNQGCIYTDGQYNVQHDERAINFLKKFPRIEVCPLYYNPPKNKSKKKWTPTSSVTVPSAYRNTYLNIENENELYFYINKKWRKAKSSPAHRGKADITAIVSWLRSNNMSEKALNPNTVFNIYNNSPGFLEFQERVEKKVAELKTLLFDSGGIISTLKNSGCGSRSLEEWLHKEIGIKNIDKIFPIDEQPNWENYESKYGRVWEGELVFHLQITEYNKYLKKKNYLYSNSGTKPITVIENIIDKIDFSLINIYGKIVNADGSPATGVRAKFDKSENLYSGTGHCMKEYADKNGDFNYYYIKKGNSTETREVSANNLEGQKIKEVIEIDSKKKKSYYTLLTLQPKCPEEYSWDSDKLECIKDCGPNSHTEGTGNNQICKCDENYVWNKDSSLCVLKENSENKHDEKEQEEEEDSSTQTSEGMDIKDGLSKIENLFNQIQETQEAAKGKFGEIKDEGTELKAVLKDYGKNTKRIVEQVNDLIKESTQESQEISIKIKELSQKMTDLRSDSENLALSVCETYEELSTVSNIKLVDKLIKNASKKRVELYETKAEAKNTSTQMEVLKNRAQNLDSAIKIFIMKAELIMKNANKLIEERTNVDAKINILQEDVKVLSGLNNQSIEILDKSSVLMTSLTGQYISLGKPKEYKNSNSTAEKVYKNTKRLNNKTNNLNKSGIKINTTASTYQQKIISYQEQLNNSVQILKVKTSGAWEADINTSKEEIIATYEAGMLFFDPINSAADNSDICMEGIKARHSVLAESQCSYLGSRGQWALHQKSQKTICECKQPYYFNSKRTKCLTLEEYQQEQREIKERKRKSATALVGILTDVANILDENKSKPKQSQTTPPLQSNESPLKDIVVKERTVTITVWDNECEDGDKITLKINGRVYLSNYLLTNAKKSFQVTLPTGNSSLELIAVDSGTDCPPKANKADTINSSAISVSNAVSGGRQSWRLKQGSASRSNFIVKQ